MFPKSHAYFRGFGALLVRLLLAVIVLAPAPAWSGAVLFIYPTLVMFEGNQRSATITLTNRGDATGTFETSWADLMMTPEGGLVKTEGDAPWSIQSYVRHSPRRVTLEPSESQVVKIALRRGAEVPEGEYYSHFKVLTLNSEDLATSQSDTAEPSTTETAVTIKARTAVAIPIIWRNSRASSDATIESVAFDRDTNQLAVNVQRHGRLSVRGYLHVVGSAPNGSRRPFAAPVPLVIYPGLNSRTMTIALNDDITFDNLADGAEVIYAPDIEFVDPETVFASYPITP